MNHCGAIAAQPAAVPRVEKTGVPDVGSRSLRRLNAAIGARAGEMTCVSARGTTEERDVSSCAHSPAATGTQRPKLISAGIGNTSHRRDQRSTSMREHDASERQSQPSRSSHTTPQPLVSCRLTLAHRPR